MKPLLAFLMLAILPGCGTPTPTQSSSKSANAQPRKTYTDVGLQGVYLVDTAFAQSVINTYVRDQYVISEILSDVPLIFAIGDQCISSPEQVWIKQEEQRAVDAGYRIAKSGPYRAPSNTRCYQYFVNLQYTDVDSVVEWKVNVREFTSNTIALSDALRMKRQGMIEPQTFSRESQATGTMKKPPLPKDVIERIPSNQRHSMTAGTFTTTEIEPINDGVSIWQLIRLWSSGDRFFNEDQTILTLDIRRFPNEKDTDVGDQETIDEDILEFDIEK